MKIKEILAAEKEEKNIKTDSLSTGLKDIDHLLGGIAPGEIMMISCAIEPDKKAFALPCALNSAVKNRVKTLYLSSAKPYHLAKRLIWAQAREPVFLPSYKRNAKAIRSAIEKLDKAPLYIESLEDIGTDELRDMFTHYAYAEPAKDVEGMAPVEIYTRDIPPWLVIMDSIDYAYDRYPKGGDNWKVRCELLQKFIKEIKEAAKTHNAAVIMTAGALSSEKTEYAENSREVASCSPLIDALCLLERDSADRQDRAVFAVIKSKRGAAGMLNLEVNNDIGIIEDIKSYERRR